MHFASSGVNISNSDDTATISHVELTSMLNSLGSTLSAATVNCFVRHVKKPQERELTISETVQSFETESADRPMRGNTSLDDYPLVTVPSDSQYRTISLLANSPPARQVGSRIFSIGPIPFMLCQMLRPESCPLIISCQHGSSILRYLLRRGGGLWIGFGSRGSLRAPHQRQAFSAVPPPAAEQEGHDGYHHPPGHMRQR